MSWGIYLNPTEREILKRARLKSLEQASVIITPICDICGHRQAEHEIEEDNAYCLGGIATVEGQCACKKFVEPKVQVAGCATGRLSSSSPNLQNFPIHSSSANSQSRRVEITRGQFKGSLGSIVSGESERRIYRVQLDAPALDGEGRELGLVYLFSSEFRPLQGE